jgi:hypothetical protein
VRSKTLLIEMSWTNKGGCRTDKGSGIPQSATCSGDPGHQITGCWRPRWSLRLTREQMKSESAAKQAPPRFSVILGFLMTCSDLLPTPAGLGSAARSCRGEHFAR